MASRHLINVAAAALIAASCAAQTQTGGGMFIPGVPGVPAPSGTDCLLPFAGACYDSVDDAFEALERFKGGYATLEERLLRRAAFNVSAAIIEDFNSALPDKGFKLGLNPTADLTDAEFQARYLGLKAAPTAPTVQFDGGSTGLDGSVPARRLRSGTSALSGKASVRAAVEKYRAQEEATSTPGDAAASDPSSGDHHDARKLQSLTAVDWVAAGKVGPVKDQGQCGSCWAFATIAAVETNAAIAGLPLTPLSEQLLVDCDTANYGCSGGDMVEAFTWLIQRGGACTSTAYPYKATQGACSNTCPAAVKLSSYTMPRTTDASLAAATAKGAVSVAVQADSSAFRFYVSGVLDSTACGTNLNHGVTVVGQGTDGLTGKDFFKVRNSWGTGWGEAGYVRIAAGKNMCGIAMYQAQPVIDASFNPSGVSVPSATPTRSPSASASRSAAATRTTTATASSSAAPSQTMTMTASGTATATATPSATLSTGASPSNTPSSTPSISFSSTTTATPSASTSAAVKPSSGAAAADPGAGGAAPAPVFPSSPSGSSSSSASSGAGMPVGVIAGIAVGAVAALALVAIAVALVVRAARRGSSVNSNTSPVATGAGR